MQLVVVVVITNAVPGTHVSPQPRLHLKWRSQPEHYSLEWKEAWDWQPSWLHFLQHTLDKS